MRSQPVLQVVLFECLALCGTLVSGCASPEVQPGSAAPSVAPTPAQSETSVEDFAQSLVRALEHESAEPFLQMVDWSQLFDRAMKDLRFSSASRIRIEAETRRTCTVHSSISDSVSGGATLTLMSVSREDHAHRIAIRALSGNVPLYWLFLAVDSDSNCRIVDYRVLGEGFWDSQRVRFMHLDAAIDEGRGNAARMTNAELQCRSHAAEVATLMRHWIARDYEAGKRIYEQLPEEVRRSAALRGTYLGVSNSRALEDHEQALRTAENDQLLAPDLDFHRFTAECRRKDRAPDFEPIERLIAYLGNDAVLESMAGMSCLRTDDADEARKRLQRAVSWEPTLAMPYLWLLPVTLKAGDTRAAVELLADLETKARYTMVEIDTLLEEPIYCEFVLTQEYRDWFLARDRAGSTTAEHFARFIANALGANAKSALRECTAFHEFVRIETRPRNLANEHFGVHVPRPEWTPKLVETIHAALAGHDTLVTVLRVHERAERTYEAVLRAVSMTSFAHVALVIADTDAGHTIVDVFTPASGQYFGETVSEVAGASALRAVAAKHGGLTDAQRELLDVSDRKAEAQTFARQGEVSRALRLLETLPEPWRDSRSTLALGFKIATENDAGDVEYRKLADRLLSAQRDDARVAYLLMAACLKLQDYERAHAALDGVVRLLGNDSCLEFLRADIFSRQKQADRANACLERAIALEPTLHLPYMKLLEDAASAREFEAAVAVLRRIDQANALELDAVALQTAYPDLVRSQAYEDWRATRSHR